MSKKKEEKTNVMRLLEQGGVPYTPHAYEHREGEEFSDGLSTAQAMGEDPARVFKTLVARGASRGIYVFVIPVGDTLDLKKAARAVGEKSVELTAVKELQGLTGYIRGGCSPVGMKKQYPTVFHSSAAEGETVFVSAGKIGFQIECKPNDLVAYVGAKLADITV